MGFTTQLFLFIFTPICLSLYYVVCILEKIKWIKRIRLKDILLVVFSCGFYAWACLDNIFKLLMYIIVIYIFGRIIQKSKENKNYIKIEQDNKKEKKLYISMLVLTIVVSLVTFYLIYYKYSPALVYVWNYVFGDSYEAHNLIAPLALSFITFSAISYLVDIYREDATEGSLLDCALYILFFPKIVSGPIVLWKNFQYQISNRKLSLDLTIKGINQIMIGFAKKVILADSFGSCISSMGTSNVDKITAMGAILLYMMQIYYDFSGYSDIAIGFSNLFGIQCDSNFNFPYRSKSITEFWRRWHISLGTWFKEYIYIPLGGSRNGLKVTLRNLFIVFVLTGLWHGCGKAYLLWGIINAIFIMLERVIKDKKFYKKMPNCIKYICTMFIVMLFWQLFRFESIAGTIRWFGIALGFITFDRIYYTWQYFFDTRMLCFLSIAILGATVLGNSRINEVYKKIVSKKTGYLMQEIIMFLFFIIAILFMVNSTYSPFIYFRY